MQESDIFVHVTDHDLDHLDRPTSVVMACCVGSGYLTVQFQPEKHVLDQSDHPAFTRQHDL